LLERRNCVNAQTARLKPPQSDVALRFQPSHGHGLLVAKGDVRAPQRLRIARRR
jgi:hypothetical protein